MTRTCFGHNLTILREYKNSYNEVATIFSFRWCGGMRLYAYVIPVCSIDAPAVSGGVLELAQRLGPRCLHTVVQRVMVVRLLFRDQ